MAALDFPASPTLNQVYTANGRSWIWDGVAWNPYGADSPDIFIGTTGITGGTAGRLLSSGTTVGEQTLGTGVATALGQNVTGSGSIVLGTSPTLTTPALGTPSALTLTNATGLPLATAVTGTLPIASGGTGQTSQTAAFDALAPTTTKGDIIVSNGSDNVRVPIGTDGHTLVADSAEATGVKWAAGGGASDLLSNLVSSEISVTGATTATISRMHVCSGTSADYTLTLPAASGNSGRLIGVRMAAGLTKLVTIDANSTELIDGEQTRIMWAGESAILLCDGTGWSKIAGKSIPMTARAALAISGAGAQTIATATVTKVNLTAAEYDSTGTIVDLVNDRLIIRRSGVYQFAGVVNWDGTGSWSASRIYSRIRKNGSTDLVSAESNTVSGSFPTNSPIASAVILASDYIELTASQNSGTSRSLYGDSLCYLSLLEIITW